MRIRIVDNEGGLANLEQDWDHLLKVSSQDFPFFSWTWYSTWWKHFGGKGELCVLVAEEPDGCIKGIAPLYRRHTKLRGLPIRELRFMNSGIGPRNTFVLEQGQSGMCALLEMVEWLSTNRAKWDLITLSNVDTASPYVEELIGSAQNAGLYTLEEPARQSPFIQMEGEFEEYWADNFKSRQRNNVLRPLRMHGERGTCQVISYTDVRDMDKALELAFQVSASSWKSRRATHMSGSREREAFYRDITKSLAEKGQIRIWISMLNDTPIALEYQLTSEHAVHLLVNDFDDAFHSLSPGNVLLYHVVRELYGERVSEYDFCGNAYKYEKIWATDARQHVSLQMFNSTFYSRVIHVTKTRILPTIRAIHGTIASALMKRTTEELVKSDN